MDLRLVSKVAKDGRGTTTTTMRASVVEELAADEKMVAMFEVPAEAKYHVAIQALLWN